MGSFTEGVLSFEFADWTPDYVLAAFSALAVPAPPSGAPELPPPVEEAWSDFEPDWRVAGWPEGEGDPFEHQPWRHDWAGWVATAMGIKTAPHGRLAWSDLRRWNLDCRFSWKTTPDVMSEALAWLAPFVHHPGDPGKPLVVGHAQHEYAPRPHLFLVERGRWKLEDLNENDLWMF